MGEKRKDGRKSASKGSTKPSERKPRGRKGKQAAAKRPIKEKVRRTHTVSLTLSDRELEVLDEYIALFGGRSRAAVIREGAIRFVREKVIDQKTVLFPEYGPSALIRAQCAEQPSLFGKQDDKDNPASGAIDPKP